MAKKKKIPDKYQKWIYARTRFHLSHAHIQMARELGLNLKKFGSLVNTKQEQWKLPLPQFIEKIYLRHFKKERPDNVRSIEQMVKDYNRKKKGRKLRKKKQQKQTDE
jgi:fructose-1,6-bisphosphatase